MVPEDRRTVYPSARTVPDRLGLRSHQRLRAAVAA